MNRQTLAISGLLVAVALPAGCFLRPNRPATMPVRGKVTFHGQPVAGAAVAFLAAGAPRPAVGITDGTGSFRLTMYQPDDGAIVGTHVVTVRKLSADSASTSPAVGDATDAAVDPAAIEQAMKQQSRQLRSARSELPSKYADRKSSELRFEVVDGDNYFEIELAN